MNTSRGSVDLTFSVASYGDDSDLDLEMTYRRAAAYRRNVAKANEISKRILPEHVRD